MVPVDVQIPGSRRPAELHCKVDTRAQGNVLPMRTYKKMFPNHVNNQGLPVKLVEQRPHVRLDAYNGTEIPQHGVIKLKIKYAHVSNQWLETEFYLAETTGPIILGKNTSIKLGIITVNARPSIDNLSLKVIDIRTAQPQLSDPIP